ncbi:RNA polymerase factor sigma-54 [Bacillus sp. Marseille-P3661]|uniref:RNA polymerase factor sigma-54 n=1 Tax=Bacillus sp. Marseille-P3661 TaxID=1936234 RepID=UPI000C82FBC2|nr:RNA polymerase factor sigma-54 [Bacillus sp. Marseille-P3661]
MKQELIQHQTTKLVMTTELRQAISLLQYSSAELNQFLQQQAVENPLLDMESISNPTVSLLGKSPNFKSTDSDEKQKMILNIADQTSNSLHEHLLNQIAIMRFSVHEKEVLEHLVLSVDDNGYFTGNLQDVADKFHTPEPVVEMLLYRMQQCEPLGVGARNLQECLLIQLRDLPERNELAEKIVSDYLNEMANRKWKKISQELDVPITKIQGIFDFIQTLNPRPGALFSNNHSQYIIPDMTIKEVNGTFKIIINNKVIPTIRLEQGYEQRISGHSEIDSYIKGHWDQFNFIKKAIEQRFMTMEKVMAAIIEVQREFFTKGRAYLKPLTLKDIAAKIDMHESTVSRTVNGKYVQTPQGVFELKYFFTSSIQTNDEDDTSSAAVKEAIREIVDQENKQKPLSDQKIATILKEQYQFNVSRRTIAKYRDQLGILSSAGRKRYE